MDYFKLHFNLSQPIICLNWVVRPSKLGWLQVVEICNSTAIAIMMHRRSIVAKIALSLSSESGHKNLKELVLLLQYGCQVNGCWGMGRWRR